jgi:hypothetical protein
MLMAKLPLPAGEDWGEGVVISQLTLTLSCRHFSPALTPENDTEHIGSLALHLSSPIKKGLLAGMAVVVLAGAAVGVAAAQTQPSPAQSARDTYETALANRLHISVDQLRQAIQGARQDVAAQRPARPAAPNGNAGPGPRGFAGRAGFAFLGAEAQAVAGLFKESPQDLRAELPGHTLAELAANHGVKVDDLVSTIVQTANEQIDKSAQNRNISADRLGQLKQQISERAQQFVTTHRFPARGSGIRS